MLTNRGNIQFDQRQFLARSSFNLSLSDLSLGAAPESGGQGVASGDGSSDWTPGQARGGRGQARGGRGQARGGRGQARGGSVAAGDSVYQGDWSLWGRGALTHFSGQDSGVRLDGEVLTGLLGVDYAKGHWLAGLALAYHDGDGSYTSVRNAGAGELDSTLVTVNPYLRYALTERLSVWGTLGYGAGTLQLRRQGTALAAAPGEIIETDLGMGMGALGLRGVVYAGASTQLAVKTDALWVRTSSDRTEGMQGARADTGRLRLLLAGQHRRLLANDAMLSPGVELGIRYDEGDAETGFGMELGGGLRYADPLRGLTIETRAPQHSQTAQGRLRAELGYGLDVPWTHGILIPYSGMEWGGASRTLRLGWRFTLGQRLSLSLDGERRESAQAEPEHALMLRTSLPW